MKATCFGFMVAAGALLSPSVQGGPRSSANYSVPADTADAGGAKATSAAYSNDGSVGSIGGVSATTTPLFTAKHSYIGQLYDVTGVSLAANPLNVKEGTTSQLTGSAVLDDATFLPLAATALSWGVSSGPINSINPTGLATAGNVYQDTAAVVHGDYLGQSGTLTLMVLNVGTDDFGAYAGDGIDDAWQVHYFGLNNPNAAPTADPDGDGQNNLFEYIAGTDPTDSLAKFQFSIAPVADQPGQQNLIFSPRFPSRTYTVQSRDDLSAGSFAPLLGTTTTDNGTQRTVTDLNATGASRFYRVQITLP